MATMRTPHPIKISASSCNQGDVVRVTNLTTNGTTTTSLPTTTFIPSTTTTRKKLKKKCMPASIYGYEITANNDLKLFNRHDIKPSKANGFNKFEYFYK